MSPVTELNSGSLPHSELALCVIADAKEMGIIFIERGK